MASKQDRIADGINKPLMGMAVAVMAVGLLLSITIALLPLGLVVMAIGAVWVAILYFSSRVRAKIETESIQHY